MCHLSRKLYALSTKIKRINPDPTTHSDQINRKSKSRLIFLNTQSQQKNAQQTTSSIIKKWGEKENLTLKISLLFLLYKRFYSLP